MTRDLVEAAQRGDHSAFEALTVVRVDRLFTVARLILRDVHLAEDAVQETLLRTWQQLPRLPCIAQLVRSFAKKPGQPATVLQPTRKRRSTDEDVSVP